MVVTLILMGAYLVTRALRTNEEQAVDTETGSPAVSVPSEDPNTAFIRLGEAPLSASPGDTWRIGIVSNTWASCSGDVYDPSGTAHLFSTPEEAKATFVQAGEFQWSWAVPDEAESGEWTIRFLCGTFENLATAEVSVRVE